MLTRYEEIDALVPHEEWQGKQPAKLRLALRTALDGHRATTLRFTEDLTEKGAEYSWRWSFLPMVGTEYELDLLVSLYTKGAKETGLKLGQMLGNDLAMTVNEAMLALVQSHTARRFMQLYREFISAGELKLVEVI